MVEGNKEKFKAKKYFIAVKFKLSISEYIVVFLSTEVSVRLNSLLKRVEKLRDRFQVDYDRLLLFFLVRREKQRGCLQSISRWLRV